MNEGMHEIEPACRQAGIQRS